MVGRDEKADRWIGEEMCVLDSAGIEDDMGGRRERERR